MRLQITVHRHGLAPVRNVFNTKAQQLQIAGHSIVTISDLLRAIDYIIPIVSEHWGSEDYAVETRLNDNQTQQYEVFHWQNINDVFSEDDELVIRPRSTREIREGERNGRRQISPNGRRIYDGSFWNKHLLAQNRPAVHIPPRGSTQEDEYFRPIEGQRAAFIEQEDQDEPQLQIEGGEHWLNEDDDDDDDDEHDDDYEEAEDAEDNESDTSTEGSIASDEADVEDESDARAAATSNGNVLTEIVFDENGEKQPADLEIATPDLTSKKRKRVRITEGKKAASRKSISQKRRRIEIAEDDHAHPADLPQLSASTRVDERAIMQVNGHNGNNDAADNTSSDGSSDESSDSDHDNDEGQAHKGAVVSGVANGDRHSADDSSSSDSESDSSSSASSNSDDESDSSSLSGESSSSIGQPADRVRTKAKPVKGTDQELETTKASEQVVAALAITKPSVAPGKGSLRTHKHNMRKKKNKLMNKLKEEGKLPKDADFAVLDKYLGKENGGPESAELASDIAESGVHEDPDLAAKRAELLTRLDLDTILPDDGIAAQVEEFPTDQEHLKNDVPTSAVQRLVEKCHAAHSLLDAPTIMENVANAQSQADPTSAPTNPDIETISEEPSPKRVRLDVASSRRMLFSALGVRNPKTPAAEQALREKLAKPTRKVKESKADVAEVPYIEPESENADRWKQKLVVKAVECVQNKQVDVPPFPFQHPWQIRKQRQEAARTQKQHEQPSYPYTQNDYREEVEEQTLPDEEIVTTHPSRLSRISNVDGAIDLDSIPIPSDFDALYDFQAHDLVEGAVIAYKELHINERFEPAQSPYRVARIIANNDSNLQVRLALQYREQAQPQTDEETGERLYSKFDVPDQDDEVPDDGLREIAFGDMINPKFVAPSDSAEIVIAESTDISANDQHPTKAVPASVKLRGGFVDASSSSKAHESQPQIDTQRKAQISSIIKDAGFESALDEQLLQPLSNEQVDDNDVAASGEHSPKRTSDAWHSSAEPASSPAHPMPASSMIRGSSVPSESIVESVRYPNLSQLGLDTPAKDLQSSSHQEAQRMTPTPLNTSVLFEPVDRSGVNHEDDGNASQLDAAAMEEPSFIPETQTQDFAQAPTSPLPLPEEEVGNGNPFQGLERSKSPSVDDSRSDEESMDSSGIPNLSQLSSQRSRSRHSSAASRVKPEPTRRSPRVNKTASQLENHFSEEKDSPPPPVKISASQKHPRLSQIPEDTVVVDLTQSSPPGSPEKSKTDGPKRGPRRSLFSGSSQHAKAIRQSFSGLGQSSLLRKKRTSS